MSLYKKTLDTFIDEYENGKLTDPNEIGFIEDFYYKLPLDRSKSTMNRICWAIEDAFDGVDLFNGVDFDYSILKSGVEYDKDLYNVVAHICSTYKPVLQFAKKSAVLYGEKEDSDDWHGVDIILQNLIENLYTNCPNEDALCDILVDLCYGKNIPKQIVWQASGNVILSRLLQRRNYTMSYPKRSVDGDFWCQGISYRMEKINVKGGEELETIQI